MPYFKNLVNRLCLITQKFSVPHHSICHSQSIAKKMKKKKAIPFKITSHMKNVGIYLKETTHL